MHSAQKDTTYTKIFVGGLPYHTTDSSLRKYFEVYGDIEEAVVITDRQTGKSRGYGFASHLAYLRSTQHSSKDPMAAAAAAAYDQYPYAASPAPAGYMAAASY
ncbi:hypothetical protein CRUP_004423, partial [Coryphaenoides rupestris]